jgi:hypothetical protein
MAPEDSDRLLDHFRVQVPSEASSHIRLSPALSCIKPRQSRTAILHPNDGVNGVKHVYTMCIKNGR